MFVLHPSSRCDVCLDAFSWETDMAPYAIPCGHVFCKTCLTAVVPPKCPLCRKNYDPERLKKLHVDRLDGVDAEDTKEGEYLQRVALSFDAPEEQLQELVQELDDWLRDRLPDTCQPLRKARLALDKYQDLRFTGIESKREISGLKEDLNNLRRTMDVEKEQSKLIECQLLRKKEELEIQLDSYKTELEQLRAEMQRRTNHRNPLPPPPQPVSFERYPAFSKLGGPSWHSDTTGGSMLPPTKAPASYVHPRNFWPDDDRENQARVLHESNGVKHNRKTKPNDPSLELYRSVYGTQARPATTNSLPMASSSAALETPKPKPGIIPGATASNKFMPPDPEVEKQRGYHAFTAPEAVPFPSHEAHPKAPFDPARDAMDPYSLTASLLPEYVNGYTEGYTSAFQTVNAVASGSRSKGPEASTSSNGETLSSLLDRPERDRERREQREKRRKEQGRDKESRREKERERERRGDPDRVREVRDREREQPGSDREHRSREEKERLRAERALRHREREQRERDKERERAARERPAGTGSGSGSGSSSRRRDTLPEQISSLTAGPSRPPRSDEEVARHRTRSRRSRPSEMELEIAHRTQGQAQAALASILSDNPGRVRRTSLAARPHTNAPILQSQATNPSQSQHAPPPQPPSAHAPISMAHPTPRPVLPSLPPSETGHETVMNSPASRHSIQSDISNASSWGTVSSGGPNDDMTPNSFMSLNLRNFSQHHHSAMPMGPTPSSPVRPIIQVEESSSEEEDEEEEETETEQEGPVVPPQTRAASRPTRNNAPMPPASAPARRSTEQVSHVPPQAHSQPQAQGRFWTGPYPQSAAPASQAHGTRYTQAGAQHYQNPTSATDMNHARARQHAHGHSNSQPHSLAHGVSANGNGDARARRVSTSQAGVAPVPASLLINGAAPNGVGNPIRSAPVSQWQQTMGPNREQEESSSEEDEDETDDGEEEESDEEEEPQPVVALQAPPQPPTPLDTANTGNALGLAIAPEPMQISAPRPRVSSRTFLRSFSHDNYVH
ncbi:hypothetical protein FA15DRAFT_627904 [Coprinopsis marcescibilis]|uniref:RING-type domain-containing protein n=1 Tax=Coprinopsis marcescibilis TaxID=230819 RepID=A0A5C3KFH1_COPMA|nr:hypothetical protein FA15DRAFT_627904 [Coprinopsis marcescibilis]